MANITKTELLKEVREKSGLTAAQAEAAVNAVISSITGSVRKGDSIRLAGLGTFKPKNSDERPGRNPSTGEPMTIAAKRSIGFKAASDWEGGK